MFAHFNGRLVPEREAVVPVSDRGFLYGDGLFETIRVCRGQAFRLREHLARLAQGAAFLKIKLPFTADQLEQQVGELIAQNQTPEALLRVTLSRGSGERGYLPRNAHQPTLVMTLHAAPSFDPNRVIEWAVISSTHRVPVSDALAGFKTANKLLNVLARMEAEARGAEEALLCDTAGHVVEAASSNLFWLQRGAFLTPPRGAGLLPGVTRAVVLELCAERGTPVSERNVTLDELSAAEGIFLTQSAFGVAAVNRLDGRSVPVPALINDLHRAYCRELTSA